MKWIFFCRINTDRSYSSHMFPIASIVVGNYLQVCFSKKVESAIKYTKSQLIVICTFDLLFKRWLEVPF